MSDKKRKGLIGKAGDLLRSFDNYGESASFLIKGKSKENTICGSLISILILLVTLSYAVRRFNVMRNYQDTTHIKVEEHNVNN